MGWMWWWWEQENVLCAFNIGLVVLMNHMNTKTLINIQKVIIDIRQRLVILLQRLKQHTLGLKELLGHDGIRHALQHESPRSSVRPDMRSTEEYKTKCRHIYRSVVFMIRHSQVIRVQQRTLHQDTTEAVTHPDNRV